MKKSKMKKHMKHLLRIIGEYEIIDKEYNSRLKECNHKLNIANGTIKEQIDEIHSLNVINEMNERHLKIAESEIKRLNVILNHTEMKYDEKVKLIKDIENE